MRAIDTNVLVAAAGMNAQRLIARDDRPQLIAAEAFIAQGRLRWPTAGSLRVRAGACRSALGLSTVYDAGPDKTAAAVEMPLDNNAVVVQDREAVVEALELFKAKPSLGFSDYLILCLARRAGHVPLGTFDRNPAKLDGVQRL